MKILVNAIKYGFPLLVITDMSSNILSNGLILLTSQLIRSFLLFLFIIENWRYFAIIKKFYFYKFFLVFASVLLLYVFTDRNIAEGFWMFFRMLFWVLGLNVLFVYAYLGIFSIYDFFKVVRHVVIIAFIFTLYFYVSGFIKEDYNVAAYLILSCYPIVLYSSKLFTKNIILLILCMLGIFITIKRGAVIAFSLATIIYYIGGLYSNFSVKKIFFGITLLSLFLFSAIYVIEQQKDRLEERLSAEQFDVNNESAGSGRVGMYTKIFDKWINSENLIFGFGNQEDSHRKRGRRTHAHSDIFGFLYNFGIVGILLILFFYRKIVLFYLKIRKQKTNNSNIVISIFVILFLVNLYSGLFYLTETIYLFALLPYLQIEQYKSAQFNSQLHK